MDQKDNNSNLNIKSPINNNYKNKIIEQRYDDNERNDNNYIIGNDYNDDMMINNNYYMNNINFEKEDNNIIENKKMENIEDFIAKESNSIQNYNFNYGDMSNYDDYKEEYNQELDSNKLYSKN